MTPDELKARIPEDEFVFITSRSSGPGGQNVNKVNTKVELHFNIQSSACLSDQEKELIYKKIKRRINSSGVLIVRSQSERSQLRNKKNAIDKLLALLSMALTQEPERIPTEPTIKSQFERVDGKRRRGKTKKLRKDSGISDIDF